MARNKSKSQSAGTSTAVQKPKAVLPKDKEEEELEKLVFGDAEGFREALKVSVEGLNEDESEAEARTRELTEEENLEGVGDDELFFIDTGPAESMQLDEESDEEATDEDEGTGAGKGLRAAWVDSDDERITISLANNPRLRKLRVTETEDLVNGKEFERRLRRQFQRMYPAPEWALPSSKRRKVQAKTVDAGSETDSSEADEFMDEDVIAEPLADLLASGSYTTSKKKRILYPEKIDIERLHDANQAKPSHSGISAVHFHPTVPLMLSAGLDSTVRLFHIDGKVNPASTSIHIRNTPIHSAAFHPSGTKVFVSGRRRYFHTWDLESGTVEKITRFYGTSTQRSTEKFRLSPDGRYIGLVAARGNINILDARTCQWICAAKVEGKVADFAWYPDGEGMSIASIGAEVSEYELRARSTVLKWNDQGGVGTTTIALGGGRSSGRWCAIGSQSGVVQIYDRSVGLEKLGTHPQPTRTLENLLTPISNLEFSHDAQLLSMASHWKKDALRLVHLPSCSVYKNWPTSSTPLGRISCLGWSPAMGGGMLAVGNENGKVRLWEVRG